MTGPITNSIWKWAGRQLEWAGLPFPTPLLPSHSYPLLGSVPLGCWPWGFLLSALPTQPWHGLPLALPLPLPFWEARPSQVLAYGLPLAADPPLPLKAIELLLCLFGHWP